MTTSMEKPCKDNNLCTKCGVHKRVKSGKCNECLREYNKQYYKANIENHKKTGKKWYSENKDGVSNKSKARYLSKKEEIKLRTRLWAKNNVFSTACVNARFKRMKGFVFSKLSISDIPPELVEIKRLQMQLHHAIKNLQQSSNCV